MEPILFTKKIANVNNLSKLEKCMYSVYVIVVTHTIKNIEYTTGVLLVFLICFTHKKTMSQALLFFNAVRLQVLVKNIFIRRHS